MKRVPIMLLFTTSRPVEVSTPWPEILSGPAGEVARTLAENAGRRGAVFTLKADGVVLDLDVALPDDAQVVELVEHASSTDVAAQNLAELASAHRPAVLREIAATHGVPVPKGSSKIDVVAAIVDQVGVDALLTVVEEKE